LLSGGIDLRERKTTCVFLPQVPNVRTEVFKLPNCHNSNTIWKTNEYKKISTIINQKSSNHKTSTCLMLFCNHLGYMTAKYWASAIKERYNLNLIRVIIHLSLSFKYI